MDPFATYEEIGVRSFGRGIFHKPQITGAELGRKRVFAIQTGDLIFNNVFAWEGAVAVASQAERGKIGSHRFMTYVPINEGVDLSFVRYFFLTEAGIALLGKASPGSAGRNRTLAIDRFEAIEIPLPEFAEQQRVAARLDNLLNRSADLRRASDALEATKVAEVQPVLVEEALAKHADATRRLGQIVEFVNDLVRPGDDPAPAHVFVGLQHIESHTGRRTGDLPLGDEKGRKFRFSPGDVLYGYLRPYLNKVWVADLSGLCSVEQYVLRSRGEVPAEYIAHALRSASVLREANRLTHNLQLPRLRSGLLAQIEVPIANGSYESVLGELDSIRDRVVSLAEHARARATHVVALEKSILNHAFAGKL